MTSNPLFPARLRASAAVFAMLALMLHGAAAQAQRLPQVPYVSTPQNVVDRMLDLAKVGPGDVVYDLGCGDGRIVITAAKRHGARGVGIDLDPKRIEEANANAKAAGVENRVKFIPADLFKSDFSEATVVTLYLLPEVNVALRPQLWRQLKTGTRVVSHAFEMGPEWPPEGNDWVNSHALYMWTITEKLKQAPR
jgi:ubiquinone/menaquinone biosynthesis C-methylase UbiE